ncbi:hypothetical protein FJ948_12575 [Mesorhizobium sp. B2-3-12]|nr:hypothetical protein FJ948_12575 [Mesorhizobium sp. B2-3-12]
MHVAQKWSRFWEDDMHGRWRICAVASVAFRALCGCFETAEAPLLWLLYGAASGAIKNRG